MYEKPTFRSEQINQGLLWEKVEILEKDNGFSLVKMPDGYEAWIDNMQLSNYRDFDQRRVTVRSHVAKIYLKPDNSSQLIRDITIGRTLPVTGEQDGWLKTVLPDGIEGWLEKEKTGTFPELSRNNVVEMAREFTGYPYCWGGRTPKGLDCSGYVQLVFSLLGRQLPRDSWMQFEQGEEGPSDFRKALPGDLLFFAREQNRINHVGIALGNNKILHARGMVRIDSLDPDSELYCPILSRNFAGIKSYLSQPK